MTQVSTLPVPQVRAHGHEAARAIPYAVEKVTAALRHAPEPVLFARLTLDSMAPGNRVDAHVDVNGATVHVHAVGVTMPEAVDLLQDRLRSRLRRLRRG